MKNNFILLIIKNMQTKYIQIFNKKNYKYDTIKNKFVDVEEYFEEGIGSSNFIPVQNNYKISTILEKFKNRIDGKYFEIRFGDFKNYKVEYKNF